MRSAIIGVDVGSVRIGIAISERVDLPAMPLTTIQHTNRIEDVASIVRLAQERGAETIVVGYPLRLDGTPGPAAAKIDQFLEALRAAFEGAVVAVDERMTTGAATKKLAGGELSARRRRSVVDQMAAVEILETYRSRAARA